MSLASFAPATSSNGPIDTLDPVIPTPDAGGADACLAI
jgi:hypothetical protein